MEASLKYKYNILLKRLSKAESKFTYEINLMDRALGYPHVVNQAERIEYAKGGVKKVKKQLEEFEEKFPEFFISFIFINILIFSFTGMIIPVI